MNAPTVHTDGHKIRVLVVDDYPLVRRGVRALLEQQADIEVVGEAGDGLQAIQMARLVTPDVILMDLSMPRMDGIEATHRITSDQPGQRIVVMTNDDSDAGILPAVRAGAVGLLLKDAPPESLVVMLRSVYNDDLALPSLVAHKMMTQLAGSPEGTQSLLTREEAQVLHLLARGTGCREIAALLDISDDAVHAQTRSVLNKLKYPPSTKLVV